MIRSARASSKGLAMAVGAGLAALVGVAAACSSTPRAPPSGGTGACGDGYLAATNGTCPRGFCLEPDAGDGCCGAQCPTCEDEGLVSLEDSGVCPQGTCISGNLTEALTCCDVCPGGEAGAADAGEEAGAGGEAGGGDGAGGDAGDAGGQ